jgi:hypothetical protein
MEVACDVTALGIRLLSHKVAIFVFDEVSEKKHKIPLTSSFIVHTDII